MTEADAQICGVIICPAAPQPPSLSPDMCHQDRQIYLASRNNKLCFHIFSPPLLHLLPHPRSPLDNLYLPAASPRSRSRPLRQPQQQQPRLGLLTPTPQLRPPTAWQCKGGRGGMPVSSLRTPRAPPLQSPRHPLLAP